MKIATLLLAMLPTIALACPKGSSEFNGSCVIELQPVESAKVNDPSWISDEKPPRTTTGEWQTGKFKVYYLPAQTAESETDDQIKFAQSGKKP
jgi:hypothetical protein